ncbi:MAG: adenylate/guanylate cyclase domain-containing protein [Candidatus Tectomicrobia bacterium]|nr:adenylate/guanylate cyclase domain-containing protein [Candidatus Tectomicrobia bacterium]
MYHHIVRFLPVNHTIFGIFLTVLILLTLLIDPVPLQRLDMLFADWRFELRGARQPGPEVVVVAIDEKSLDDLGRWPWPYSVQAQLVDQLTAYYGAKAIGYDVVFSASDTSAGIENLENIRQWLVLRTANGSPVDSSELAGLAALKPPTDLSRRVLGAHDPEPYGELSTLVDTLMADADRDQRFADALARSSRTVLGYFFHWERSAVQHLPEYEMLRFLQNIRASKYNALITVPGVRLKSIALPTGYAVESSIPMLSDAAWGAGFFNSYPDPDGVHRRYRLIVKYRDQVDRPNAPDDLYAPLGLRVLERYLQDENHEATTIVWAGPDGVTRVGVQSHKRMYLLPTDRKGQMLINHLGPSTPTPLFPRYSAVDIIQRNHDAAPPDALRDKIVLIGATAMGLADLYVTPFHPAFPGVEIHATVIDNILRQDFLAEPWWAPLYTTAAVLLVGLCLTLLGPRLPALLMNLLAAGLLLGSLGLNYVFFNLQGWVLNAVYPALATVIIWSGMTAWKYMAEQKDKHFLQRTFRMYLSPELIEEMVRTKTEPKLGGSSGIRTAYFTDIASFTTFSELLSPTQLVELLNEYLGAMTDILLHQGGTLDRYDGDGIVAFFGAPVLLQDHARRALHTALGMQQALAGLRAKWNAEGDKWPDLVTHMRMRIGIASGDLVTGNMGSMLRMNYSMHGDTANTAARLETSAKQYGIYLHCAAHTLQLAGAEHYAWRTIDNVKLVGKSEPVETVEILAHAGELSEDQRQMQAFYQQGIELYRLQQWEAAQAKFQDSAKLEATFPNRPTTPSRVYIERCDYFIANPPGAGWDGSWALTSK